MLIGTIKNTIVLFTVISIESYICIHHCTHKYVVYIVDKYIILSIYVFIYITSVIFPVALEIGKMHSSNVLRMM
jgi:hypothetical protein